MDSYQDSIRDYYRAPSGNSSRILLGIFLRISFGIFFPPGISLIILTLIIPFPLEFFSGTPPKFFQSEIRFWITHSLFPGFLQGILPGLHVGFLPNSIRDFSRDYFMDRSRLPPKISSENSGISSLILLGILLEISPKISLGSHLGFLPRIFKESFRVLLPDICP